MGGAHPVKLHMVAFIPRAWSLSFQANWGKNSQHAESADWLENFDSLLATDQYEIFFFSIPCPADNVFSQYNVPDSLWTLSNSVWFESENPIPGYFASWLNLIYLLPVYSQFFLSGQAIALKLSNVLRLDPESLSRLSQQHSRRVIMNKGMVTQNETEDVGRGQS